MTGDVIVVVFCSGPATFYPVAGHPVEKEKKRNTKSIREAIRHPGNESLYQELYFRLISFHNLNFHLVALLILFFCFSVLFLYFCIYLDFFVSLIMKAEAISLCRPKCNPPLH
jgi:hypothetical protein